MVGLMMVWFCKCLNGFRCFLGVFPAVCWVVFSIFFSGALHAASPVWKVQKSGQTIYLGGTIHVLAAKDYPLPAAFEKAYMASDEVVFEIDMTQMSTPATQMMLMEQSVYSDGRTIKAVLSDQVFGDLKDHFSRRGVAIESVVRFKPGMLTAMMMLQELQRLDLYGAGVDEFYMKKARKAGKRLGYLEEVEEQVAVLASLGQGRESELVAYALEELAQLGDVMEEVKSTWRLGQLDKLESIYLNQLKSEFPSAYEALLVRRNRAWLPKLEAMLASEPVELVLVGALHLAGEEGIIAVLLERGCTVEML